MNVDIPLLFFTQNHKINYFENEYFKIQIPPSPFTDLFWFSIENVDSINILYTSIHILRVDKHLGWGQDLKIMITNKINLEKQIIDIGPSQKPYFKKELVLDQKMIPNKKIHFESEYFKIYTISSDYNDIFKVNYDFSNNQLSVQRTDSNTGWGQILNCIYEQKTNLEKNSFKTLHPIMVKRKIFEIGPSENNEKRLTVDWEKIPDEIPKHIFVQNDFFFLILQNLEENLMTFSYDSHTNFLKSEKIMSSMSKKMNGWISEIKIILYKPSKPFERKNLIYIGPSNKNNTIQRVSLNEKKFFVALTTIPSRIVQPWFYEQMKFLLESQTIPFEKLFITIAKKYKRFQEEVPQEVMDKISSLSDKIDWIVLEEDFGPGSKYMGPLLHRRYIVENEYLIIIDDDRFYNPYLIEHFRTAMTSYGGEHSFSSGLWDYYFDKSYTKLEEDYYTMMVRKEESQQKFFYGNGLGGFMGFCMKCVNIDQFLKYHFEILEKVPKSFFHDEGITLNYLKAREESIIYVKHKGCNFMEKEQVHALCKSGLCNRGKVENQIFILTHMNKLL